MRTRTRTAFFLIFTLSGFSGLIYESIWTHYIKLFLGHAAYAQTLVLAIFMGGMAGGSWLSSRYSGSWGRLFMGYALAELVIGIVALVFHEAFGAALAFSYDTAIPALGSPGLIVLYKWGLAGLLILPQSVLLGMTFPLMSAAVIRNFPERPGGSLSMLYFSNSIGAAAGVLISGFVLIRLVGLPGTIRTAGLMNIMIALAVMALVRREGGESRGMPQPAAPAKGPHRAFWLMMATAFITGAASFIYEISWIRMLSLVLGSATHAFELMLSAFILGLALGGLWVRKRIDSTGDPVRFLATVQVLMGLLALSTLYLYGNTFGIMLDLLNLLQKTDMGYALFNLGSHGIAAMIMLPATFCAGMTLPLITYILISRGGGEKSIGRVYAANTLGAITGIMLSIHVGLPVLGLKGSVMAGAALDMALGLVLAWGLVRGTRPRALIAAACVLALVFTGLFAKMDSYKMASGVYRTRALLAEGTEKLLFHRDGKTATISVVEYPSGSLSLRTNGKSDGAVAPAMSSLPNGDEYTMILLGAIPMSINPQARSAANIGLGTGLTTSTLLLNQDMRKVDTIEIESAVVDAARLFESRVTLFDRDPRSTVHIDDAKSFFSSRVGKYDLIISEPSNPWVSGVSSLFTREFYALIPGYLEEDGLFTQWIHLYSMNPELVSSIMLAIGESFADYEIFIASRGDMIVVASPSGKVASPSEKVFSQGRLARMLRRINVNSTADLEMRRLGGKSMLAPLFGSFEAPVNSDYYPYLDLMAVKARFMGHDANGLFSYIDTPLPVVEVLSGSAPTGRLAHVSPLGALNKNGAILHASLIMEYLMTGREPFGFGTLPPEETGGARAFRSMLHDCAGPEDAGSRKAALFYSLRSVSGYLGTEEAGAVFREMGAWECASSLSPGEETWLRLFEAIGARDSEGMREYAHALLESEGAMPGDARRHVLAAGMLGAVASGDSAGAMRLYETYRGGIDHSGPYGALFALLLAGATR